MENTHSIMDIFGTNVFNDKAMRQYLPKSIYYELRKTIEGRKDLDPAIADVVAAAIKKWAIEKGATHYTHWFQPLTGFTAEKHDAFITSPKEDGSVLMESKENRTLPPSRQADFVQPLRPEAILPGTALPLLLSARMLLERFFVSPPHSAPSPEKHWTRRRLFFVPWKLFRNSHSVCSVSLETPPLRKWFLPSVLSRNIS